MSGHSKWSTIKRDKAANDSKKSQAFTKLTRAITVAAKSGADPETNAALRIAIEKAKQARMPKDNIERAVLKGFGGGEGSQYEEVVYEGYGPEGVAFYVRALTDNRNRTVAEIRNIFSRHGGSLGGAGSVAYIFGDVENPAFEIEILDEHKAQAVLNLVDALEDHDDVSEVYSNIKVSDELLNKFLTANSL
jgi:YebC/PmpR family DNA-binding regulatory protein